MNKIVESGSKELPSFPLIALVLTNLIPIIGVLFFGWDALALVVLYWAENLIVGFYTIVKLIFAPILRVKTIKKLIGIPIFLWLWGWFTAGHGVVIIFFFVIFPQEIAPEATWIQQLPPGDFFKTTLPGPFGLFELCIDAFRVLYYILPSKSIIMLVFLTVGHGVSFIIDYMIRGGRHSIELGQLIEEPGLRVFILQIAIMIGGFLCMVLRSNVVILVCLVLLKCWIEASLYSRRQCKRKA